MDYNISSYFSDDINYTFFEVFYALYINPVASVFRSVLSSRMIFPIFSNSQLPVHINE